MSSEAGAGLAAGELFVVSAPSGAGKTTLIRRVLGDERLRDLAFSVSHTTRPPRRGEREGHDYYFVAPETFQGMVEEGAFLEWAEVHGRLYGTSEAEVRRHLEAGRDVLLEIDVQGAESVLQRRTDAVTVFVMAPGFAELQERLRGRALDSDEQIARRLAVSSTEMRRYGIYEYVIVNDDLRHASESLVAIILARRCRRERMQARIEQVFSSFP